MKKCKLIVIEGTDGSGKATQTKLICNRLKKEGFRVETRDFPNYKNFYGKMIAKFLSEPSYDWIHVHPLIASTFYALNRHKDKGEIEKLIRHNDVVVFDRYVSANQIHQGGKIKDIGKRKEFLKELEILEYGELGIPKPNIVFFLDLPPALSQKLMGNRSKETKREYLKGKKDVHETNEEFQKNSYETGLWLSRIQPNWIRINCVKEGNIKSEEEIHDEIYNKLMQYLNSHHL